MVLGPRSRTRMRTTLSIRNERFFIDRKDAKQNETTSLSRFLFKNDWKKKLVNVRGIYRIDSQDNF